MSWVPRRRLAFKQPEPSAAHFSSPPPLTLPQPIEIDCNEAIQAATQAATQAVLQAATQAALQCATAPPGLATFAGPAAFAGPPPGPAPPPPNPGAPPVVQRTVPHDVKVLQGLHLCQLALAEAHYRLYVKDFPEMGADEWYDKLHCGGLCEWLQRGVEILHAKIDGEVVGYLSFWPPKNKGDAESSVTINHIIVLEAYRNLGIGRQLMESLGQYLDTAHGVRGTCILHLSVASANVRALRWYSLIGFCEERRKKERLRLGSNPFAPPVELLWIRLRGRPPGIGAALPPARVFLRPRRGVATAQVPPRVEPPTLRPRKRRLVLTTREQPVVLATDKRKEGEKELWPAESSAEGMSAEGSAHEPMQTQSHQSALRDSCQEG